MNILLYSNDKTGVGKKIQGVIKSMVPKIELEIYRTLDGLSDKLRQPRNTFFILVLLVVQREDFWDLMSIRDLLYDIPIILILPDSEKDTVLTAHKFYPRYVPDVSSDFSDVALVVKKMFKNAYSEKIFAIEKSETKNSSFRKPTLQQSSKEGGDIQNV